MTALRIYNKKTTVPGSKFEEYAIMSKLTGEWLIKSLRFIDPIIDDDGNIFPFVRKDHILFLDGFAISVRSLVTFLDNIFTNVYTDYPTFIKINDNDEFITLLEALKRIEVISLSRTEQRSFQIQPSSLNPISNSVRLYNDLTFRISQRDLDYEDEIIDF